MGLVCQAKDFEIYYKALKSMEASLRNEKNGSEWEEKHEGVDASISLTHLITSRK